MKCSVLVLANLVKIGLAAKIPPESVSSRVQDLVGDMGDGYYSLAFDEAGNPAEVKFTSLPELNLAKRAVGDSSSSPASLFDKRAGVSCAGSSGDTDEVNSAIDCLAGAAASGSAWTDREWHWCFFGNTVTYACSYKAQIVTSTTIYNFENALSSNCGRSSNGFYRCTDGCGVNDLAVGRAVKNSTFCDGITTGV